eukprot:177066-Rhodomonas_salina.2
MEARPACTAAVMAFLGAMLAFVGGSVTDGGGSVRAGWGPVPCALALFRNFQETQCQRCGQVQSWPPPSLSPLPLPSPSPSPSPSQRFLPHPTLPFHHVAVPLTSQGRLGAGGCAGQYY